MGDDSGLQPHCAKKSSPRFPGMSRLNCQLIRNDLPDGLGDTETLDQEGGLRVATLIRIGSKCVYVYRLWRSHNGTEWIHFPSEEAFRLNVQGDEK